MDGCDVAHKFDYLLFHLPHEILPPEFVVSVLFPSSIHLSPLFSSYCIVTSTAVALEAMQLSIRLINSSLKQGWWKCIPTDFMQS
jgi:hypothetical protein